ncbi:MAG: hypothetical protein K2X66_15220, partial [Cyanobacteria bacterium]|nr:hypothetical protein [Cyanobacteriota bacterium]
NLKALLILWKAISMKAKLTPLILNKFPGKAFSTYLLVVFALVCAISAQWLGVSFVDSAWGRESFGDLSIKDEDKETLNNNESSAKDHESIDHDGGMKVDPSFKSAGQQILESRCSACHMAPKVTQYTLYEWKTILPRMAASASLRPSESEALKAYVHSILGEGPHEGDNPPRTSQGLSEVNHSNFQN